MIQEYEEYEEERRNAQQEELALQQYEAHEQEVRNVQHEALQKYEDHEEERRIRGVRLLRKQRDRLSKAKKLRKLFHPRGCNTISSLPDSIGSEARSISLRDADNSDDSHYEVNDEEHTGRLVRLKLQAVEHEFSLCYACYTTWREQSYEHLGGLRW
jgi:hypothetical protein